MFTSMFTSLHSSSCWSIITFLCRSPPAVTYSEQCECVLHLLHAHEHAYVSSCACAIQTKSGPKNITL